MLAAVLSRIAIGQQYPFVAIQNGPRMSSRSIVFPDRSQRVWVGSEDGLYYFDGSRFFSLSRIGYPKTLVHALAEDDEGGVWIASDAGLHRFSGGALERVVEGVTESVVAISPGFLVAAIAPAGGGVTLRLYRVSRVQSRWSAKPLAGFQSRGNLTVDSKGFLVYPCNDESWCEVAASDIVRWPEGTTLTATAHPYNLPAVRAFQTVLRDRFGCLWFRNALVAAYRCPGDTRIEELPTTIAGGFSLMLLHEAPDGSIVLPGNTLLAVGRPGKFRVARAANGLPFVGDAAPGRDGTIWISTVKGLLRFMYPFRMEFWTGSDGLETVSDTLRLSKTTLVASAGIRKLSRDRARWTVLPGTARLGGVLHFLAGPDETVYAALVKRTVAQIRLDGSVVRQSTIPGAHVKLAQTPDGRLWISSGWGAERVIAKGHDFETIKSNLPAPHTLGLDIEVDSKGILWSCYAAGLVRLEPDGWHRISKDDGLLQNECRSFAVHPDGDVWYGYNSLPGFSRIRFGPGGKIQMRHFLEAEVEGGAVMFLKADRRGWLWRGTTDGWYIADPNQAESGSWLHMDASDGLPDIDTNQQAFYDDPDGSVWIGAGTTPTHFYPPVNFLHPESTPGISIAAFSWNHGEPQMAEMVGALPYRRDIEVHLGSLQFDRRNALRTRYRLLPADTSWHEGKTLDIAIRPTSWGNHIMEVQARLGNGPWSPVVRRSITVERPLWLSWQAFAVFATILLLLTTQARALLERRSRARRPLPEIGLWRQAAGIPEVRDLVGGMLGSRYQVGRVIAQGGFATVLQANDLEHGGRHCAIKVFRHDLLAEEAILRRFDQEVAALESVDHANVVPIFDHGCTPDGTPYLAMEFVEGQTLREVLEDGPLTRNRTASFLRQAGSALDAIHARNIFHRDLKPENIMIRSHSRPDEELVIIDFSIAIIKEPNESLRGLTRAAGTTNYMAPEHSIGYADASTDVYNLAKLIIEMLTARPFSSLLASAALDLPARVRALLGTLPLGLSPPAIDLIATALEFHPSMRLQRAGDFANAIAADLQAVRHG